MKTDLKTLLDIGLSCVPQEVIMFTDEPKIPGYVTGSNEEALGRYHCNDVYGQGFHPNRRIAQMKSVGEYLERLCLSNMPHPPVSMAMVTDIDISLFNCYSESQVHSKEFFRRAHQEQYRMWPVIDYFGNRKLYLPAQLIFLSDLFDDEFPLRKEQISTGAAFGQRNTNNAFMHGFLEVVERDACMISYLKKRRIPKVVGLPENLRQLIEYLQRYRLETHVYDATTDLGIPTAITIVVDATGLGPAINVGSKAAFTYESAIRGSILEAVQCRRATRFMVESQETFEFPKDYEVHSMDARYFYWYNPERLDDLNFWLEGPPEVDFSHLAESTISLEEALDSIRSMGYNLFVADLTLPEIKECGFETIKVIIPELHPLYLDERAKALYSKHAGEIEDDASLKPHPFS